jgi:hypothetical protein
VNKQFAPQQKTIRGVAEQSGAVAQYINDLTSFIVMKLGLLLLLREGRILEENAGKNVWT